MKKIIIGEKNLYLGNYKKVKDYNSIFEYDEYYECVSSIMGYRVFLEKDSSYAEKLLTMINDGVFEREIKQYIAEIVVENISAKETVEIFLERMNERFIAGKESGKVELQNKIKKIIGIEDYV